MTKTTTPGMDAHLAQEVTNLATCWRLTRTDDVEFFFTDHDVDIPFEGNIYVASSGYKRSAVQNDATMAVDNLDLEGIFNSADITEEDLRAGLFDFAGVRIFVVNWLSLADGEIKMRRGRLGEVTFTEQGIFRAELRGLTQALSQRIGELYQPECRADLGDARCTVPILPDILERSTAYIVGDFVRLATLIVSETDISVPIINPGFETGNLTGWTTVLGNPTLQTSRNGVFAHTGTFYLEGDSSVDYEIAQNVDITGLVASVDIDAGQITAAAEIFQSDSFPGDLGAFTVEALDGSDVFISTLFDSGFAERPFAGAGNVWTNVGVTMVSTPLPVGTRKIRYRLRGDRTAGAQVNAGFDDVSGVVQRYAVVVDDPNPYTHEDRIFECTFAGTTGELQPVFDMTVDATTEDGPNATGTLTLTINATDGETVTIDGKTYTFQATLTDVDGHVQLGASSAESLDNLIAAITLATPALVPEATRIPIVNPGFDTGDFTGWTTVTGVPIIYTNNRGVLGHSGTFWFEGTSGVDYEVRQDADISALVSTVDIDAGDILANAQVFQSDSFAGDLGAFTVEALDGSDVFISTLFDSGFAERPFPAAGNIWTSVGVTMTDVVLPTGTRKIRYRLRGDHTAGTEINAGFDSLSAGLRDNTATTAQYAPSTTLHPTVTAVSDTDTAMTVIAKVVGTGGNSIATTETLVNGSFANATLTGGGGGAIFTAREAWTRFAQVGVVTDRKTFTLAIDEPRAVDDWFNGGALTFEDGDNAGKVIEIRDWVQSTNTLTLFLPTAFPVAAGTTVTLYPGCDKLLATCISKFVIPGSLDFANGNVKNFRGEPFVPGSDELVRYPDAKSS